MIQERPGRLLAVIEIRLRTLQGHDPYEQEQMIHRVFSHAETDLIAYLRASEEEEEA